MVALTLVGRGFIDGSILLIDGEEAPATFMSESELSALLSLAGLAGTFAIAVRNPPPGGGDSAALTLTVLNPEPVLASISPVSAEVGSAGIDLVLSGTGFAAGSTVLFGSTAVSPTSVTAGELVAPIPVSALAVVGEVLVLVSNPAPGGGMSATTTFTDQPRRTRGPPTRRTPIPGPPFRPRARQAPGWTMGIACGPEPR